MKYEVELKFRLAGSVEQLLTHLEELQANVGSEEAQRDTYFAHPSRDFVATREALRIRSTEAENVITYKGPLIDEQTKTRQEIEIPLGDGLQSAEDFGKMLLQLGFRAVHPVRKQRTIWKLHWQNRDWELAWDEVEGLGTFLEIETITSEQSELPAVQNLLLSLAEHLKLQNPERKSYLEMILEKTPKP